MNPDETDPKIAPCPICGRLAVARHHPFCSERCQKLDLAHWLKESYRLPGTSPASMADDGSDDEGPVS